MSGFGVGGTLGIRYAPSSRVSVGLAWRTPSTIDFDGDATNGLAPIIGQAIGVPVSDAAGVERSIRWPHWVGFGTSIRLHPRWTVNADVQYNNWGSLGSIDVSYDDDTWQQLLASEAQLRLDWSDNVLWRIGVAHELTDSLTLTGGYYYDPAPSPPETTNILMPTADFHGIAAGLGWSKGRYSVQAAVEYVYGEKRSVPLGPDALMPGSHQYRLLIPQIVITRRIGD
jgi:long-chain fatty acid transport protein